MNTRGVGVAGLMVMVLGLSLSAWSQETLQNMLAGKLVQPRAGAWAWYDLVDTATNTKYMVRLAIVDEEKVGAKDGYWLEVELVPRIGFRSIYKMLLTGPSSETENVHKIVQREGTGPIQEVDFDKERRSGKDKGKDEKAGQEEPAPAKEPERTLVGEEDISLPSGPVKAQHFSFMDGDKKTELWLNDRIPPMGLVRMKSPDGEFQLQSYGDGGRNGKSAINGPVAPGKEDEDLGIKVDVSVEKKAKPGKNFAAEGKKGKESKGDKP